MSRKVKLRELIMKAQAGDQEALAELIQRFSPVIKKYSRRLGYDYEEARSDLVAWIVDAVRRYKPKTPWGRSELEQYFSEKNNRGKSS
ncbi:helix-turn-helix domain-containing protein [Thermanaeromonas sp. C210]|uniref:helix-turn-helix domain-containing protein n=1 Tax=Thermanaeromonas sp. C210 TaxID=2731925 RepID=UPI00155BEF7E|nr:helix-turn-helix domain-containing protein [Thermanaeromonas sp. C210]GFN22955.1 hypothetical protein TAMC210_12720 [Thermanaeromonas sp. C210]